jgi:hypothetical protein
VWCAGVSRLAPGWREAGSAMPDHRRGTSAHDENVSQNCASAKRVAHAISVCRARNKENLRGLERMPQPQQIITR